MADTTDYTQGASGAGYPGSRRAPIFLQEQIHDYGVTANNGGAADVAQLLDLTPRLSEAPSTVPAP